MSDIVPDTKDWTWVLDRPCAECGFDTRTVTGPDVPGLVQANVAAWATVLERPDVRQRPRPGVWSPLEYACHVRDVYRLFAERLALMLAEDEPAFANWDQDATAVESRYAEQDPAQVAVELVGAGTAVADAFAAVQDAEWGRAALRSDGARFTVESLGRYMVHDPVHHLWDVAG